MHDPADKMYRFIVGSGIGALRFLLWKTITEAIGMRVVVVKSPKMLGGVLRKLFGIKKMPREL